jgi:signal transduction histidine kinase
MDVLDINRKLQLISSVTRHDLLNKINCAEILIEEHIIQDSESGLKDDDLIAALNILIQAEKDLKFIRDYEMTGVQVPKWIDLHDALNHLIDRIPVGIELRVCLPRIQVFADNLLDHVFFNLIDNAIIHGGNLSHIQVFHRKEADTLIIIVQDDGIGVPMIEKEQIFELGYGANTGLGLFYIREILAITQIVIVENGIFHEGARFEMSIPAVGWHMN